MGKSSVVEALYWGLFGKGYRSVSLSLLVNAINRKEMEVYILFSVGTTIYRVERGIKPNFFRVYSKTENDSEFAIIPQSSTTRSYQEILEDILQLNAAIFSQTVMKSMTKEISFLTLTKKERRDIVETFLDIKIFSEMNKLCKEKVDELEKDLIDVKKNREHIQLLFTQEESNLQRLQRIQQQQREEAAASATRIEAEVRTLHREIEEFKSNIVILTKKIADRLDDNEKKAIGIEKVQKYKVKKIEFQELVAGHKRQISDLEISIEEQKSKISECQFAISIREEEQRVKIGECHLAIVKHEKEQKVKIIECQRAIANQEDLIRDWKSMISITENKVKYLTNTCGACEKINSISKADNVDQLRENVAQAESVIADNRTTVNNIEEATEQFNKDQHEIIKSIEAEIVEFKKGQGERIKSIDGMIADYKIEIVGVDADINKCNNNIAKCDEYIAYERTYTNDLATNNKFIESERSSIAQDERRIETWSQKVDDKLNTVINEAKQEIEIDFSKLEALKVQRSEMTADFDKKTILKKHYVYARKLLQDDAIKAFVVRKYLPSINAILNSYLQRFGSEIILHLDEEFEEVVTSRFKEGYKYWSFSEGQKRRIDLSILFMFITFCKTKFKQAETNLLILDEVGVGLDTESMDKLYRILRELATKENKSIITISHDSTIDVGKINHLYEVTMESGFSKITKKNI